MITLQEKYYLIRKELKSIESHNPIAILQMMANKEYISMHGPEHHFLDGACFLVAYCNKTNNNKIEEYLDELEKRTIKMPGAMCGYWGVCGSVTSLGAALSIINDVSPLTNSDFYSHNMEFASRVIKKMSEIGGPRCCKRNAFLSLEEAVKFVNEKYEVMLEDEKANCKHSKINKQCIGNKCPFYNL